MISFQVSRGACWPRTWEELWLDRVALPRPLPSPPSPLPLPSLHCLHGRQSPMHLWVVGVRQGGQIVPQCHNSALGLAAPGCPLLTTAAGVRLTCHLSGFLHCFLAGGGSIAASPSEVGGWERPHAGADCTAIQLLYDAFLHPLQPRVASRPSSAPWAPQGWVFRLATAWHAFPPGPTALHVARGECLGLGHLRGPFLEGELYPWWDIPWGWAKGHPLTLWPRVDRSEVDPGPTPGLLPLGFQELFSPGHPLRGPSSQDKGMDPRERVSLFAGQGAGTEQG